MQSQPSRTRRRIAVACAATLAGILACGGGEPTEPESPSPSASDLPIVYAYGTLGKTGPRNLHLTTADGTTTLALPDLGGDEAYPAWKPGGRDMLVTQTASGSTKLLLVNEAGSNVRTVPDVNSIARWSPDGAWIVFANSGSIFLEVMRLDGTSRRWITSAVGGPRMAHPSWSPNGRVAYTFGDEGGANGLNVQQVDVPFGGNLTSGPDDQWPAWSPDGRTIAFSMGLRNAQGGTFYEIGLVNADGSDKRRLTFDATSIDRAPAWSPDGQWVLYERWDQAMTTCSFVRVPVSGGPPVTVVAGVPNGACGGASWR